MEHDVSSEACGVSWRKPHEGTHIKDTCGQSVSEFSIGREGREADDVDIDAFALHNPGKKFES